MKVIMFTRNKIHVLLPFCLLSGFAAVGMMACANAANGNSAGYGMTPGRLEANIAASVGLISVVIGGLALARSGNGRTVALVVGLIAMILSVVHLSRSTGGFGTGSGRAGAIVALVLGLTGTILGGLAISRFRRSRQNH